MIYQKDNLLDLDQTYTYHYDGGPTELRNRFSLWLAFYSYNFGFTFIKVNSGGFFRIGFDDTKNSSAITGKQIYHSAWMDPNQNATTTNMEPSRYYTHGLEEFDITAMHEIGHMIGIEHEHLNWQNAPIYVPGHHPQIVETKRGDYEVTDYNPQAIMGYHLACTQTQDGQMCGYRNREMRLREIKEMANAFNSPRLASDDFMISAQWKSISNSILNQGAVPPMVR